MTMTNARLYILDTLERLRDTAEVCDGLDAPLDDEQGTAKHLAMVWMLLNLPHAGGMTAGEAIRAYSELALRVHTHVAAEVATKLTEGGGR